VTAASFNDSVNPSTNFQIVPQTSALVVRRLQTEVGSYGSLASGNASWNGSEINDFGNVTNEDNVNNSVVAHLNDTENGELGAQLAFDNQNTTNYSAYMDNGGTDDEWGFFEIANVGETPETVGITFGYNGDNVGATEQLSEGDVADMFNFRINGTKVSPTSGTTTEPANQVEIGAGEVAIVGLEIAIDAEAYETIQAQADATAFSPASTSSIRLLDSIEVGVDFDPNA
jgi:hypothetical protein